MTARTLMHVLIIDGLTGDTIADVDARSTMDAIAYFLASPHIPRRHEIWEVGRIRSEAAKLRALTDSSWPTPDSETPTVDFITEGRNPISNVIEWQYIARVRPVVR